MPKPEGDSGYECNSSKAKAVIHADISASAQQIKNWDLGTVITRDTWRYLLKFNKHKRLFSISDQTVRNIFFTY